MLGFAFVLPLPLVHVFLSALINRRPIVNPKVLCTVHCERPRPLWTEGGAFHSAHRWLLSLLFQTMFSVLNVNTGVLHHRVCLVSGVFVRKQVFPHGSAYLPKTQRKHMKHWRWPKCWTPQTPPEWAMTLQSVFYVTSLCSFMWNVSMLWICLLKEHISSCVFKNPLWQF